MNTEEVYPYLRDGQPWLVSKDESALQACCDCGLVHEMTFEDDPDNNQQLIIRWYRRADATATQRRLRGVSATTTGTELNQRGGESQMKNAVDYTLLRLILSTVAILLAIALMWSMPDVATIAALATIWMKISI